MSHNVTGINLGAGGDTIQGEQYLAGLSAYITRLSGLIANMTPLTTFALPEFKDVQQARSKILVEKAKSTLRFIEIITNTDTDKAVFTTMSHEQIVKMENLMDRVVESHMKTLVLMLKLEVLLAMCDE